MLSDAYRTKLNGVAGEVAELESQLKVVKRRRSKLIRHARSEGGTLREIGSEVGLSYEQVRKITP